MKGINDNMSFTMTKKLPTPIEIKEMYPVSQKATECKARNDEELQKIISGKSDKFIAVIGPCSADNEEAVCDYIGRLARVQEEIKDKVLLVARVYTNKPRTTGEGYKGMAHQPDPESDPNLLEGLIAIRHLHMRVLEEFGLPIADEMLYPENYRYLSDILSYVAVGARSVEDQHHRMVASGIEALVGMKNPTSGDLSVMLNSVSAAQHSHNFLYRGWDATTSGNPYAHTILRGAVNQYGKAIPNYHYEDLLRLLDMYNERDLQNPACIVDANHSNSNKKFKEQIRIVKEVINSRKHSEDINSFVKGVMIESYIEEGNQKIGCENHVYGKSITDPCLGWEDSKELLYYIAENC